jgi:NAD+ synthase (glutamine-hydrolysing)
VAVCARAGASLLLVPNASPYERGKDDVRLDLVVRRAREAHAALAYANMIGGQDELVFDGDSILVAADGTLVARGPQFEEALVVADLDLPAAPSGEVPGDQPVDAEAPAPRPLTGRRTPRGRSGPGCLIRPRCTRRWSPGSGTT